MRLSPTTIAGAIATSALIFAAPVAATPGSGDDSPAPTTARLASVSYDNSQVTDYPTGRLTGTPVSGGAQVTIRPALFGPEAYLKSTGFGDTPPGSVRQWDEAVDRLTAQDTFPSPLPPFAVIGNTRDLMQLASQLPPKTIVVSYVPDTYYPGYFSLTTMQPVAE
jgi:hypothetical protein